MKENNDKELLKFEVNDSDRTYQFWERNPLSVEIYSKEIAEQKLRYIHNNPRQEKWNLASSIRFQCGYSWQRRSFGQSK